jgi:hypothetical protein
MEEFQTELQRESAPPSFAPDQSAPPHRTAVDLARDMVIPQACPACGTARSAGAPATTLRPQPPSWIYAMGRIEARCPSISVEKEFAQATAREATAGLTDRRTMHAVLSKPENRYLVRQFCFVMTIEGMETYILVPRDISDSSLLVEALRPQPSPMDLDVVIGTRAGIAPPQMCNGLMLPIVSFDQIYSFDRDSLIKSIPKPEKTTAKDFAPAAEELLDYIMQMTDNAGATDEHRALNYLAVRYHQIYFRTAEYFAQNFSLTGVDVQASPLTGARRIADVIFSYTNRQTDVVEKRFVRVDVTDQFPFLVTKLSPYFDR